MAKRNEIHIIIKPVALLEISFDTLPTRGISFSIASPVVGV